MLSENEKTVIALIDQDVDKSNYFFYRVRDLKWFYPLKERLFFSPQRIPQSEKGDLLFWNVLDYLERVSEQVTDHPEYGKELLEIIESIIEFSEKQRPINNYHVWWYCVKIVNNIPFSIIKKHLSIERFRTWLSVWTNRSMVADLGIVDIGVKLLPKFLANGGAVDSNYQYAETIIDVITETKIRKTPAPSRSRQDVILGLDLYWIKEFFDKYHELIGLKCSAETILGLADKLKTALDYKQQSSHANLDIGQDVYQIKILRVPSEGLKDGVIRFLDDRYKCLVKKFSEVQIKEAEGSEYLRIIDIEPQDELKSFDFTAADAAVFVSKIIRGLPSHVDWTIADNLETDIGYIFNNLYSDYIYIWCKSLNDGPEYREDAVSVLTIVLRDVLLAKCESNREEGREVLVKLSSDRYRFPIFRRFVLLAIDRYWTDYSDLLERFLELVPSALEESDFEVELHDMLNNHNLDLSPQLTTKLKELIINVPEYYVKEGGKQSAHWQYMWLSPLRDNTDFSSMYREAKSKAELKDERPYKPERSTIKGGVVGHTSPISKEEMLRKPIDELAKYLNDFKGADSWRATFDGEPDRAGLAGVLRDAVKDDHRKFTDEINAFCDVKDHSYVHSVLMGLEEAWKAGKDLDWEKIFDFGLKFFGRDKAAILQEAIQSEGEDGGEGKYIWVIDEITDLIAEGCKNDARAFDPKYFEKVEQIFDLIVPLLKSGGRPDTQRDALTFALNTTLGRTTKAYVSFSLRVARVRERNEKNWGLNKFERFFSRGVEGIIWFACYMPQMKYLDEHYTIEKMDIFSEKASNDFEWQMFMEGYLDGSGVEYPEVYCLMRKNYIKALESIVFAKQIDKRLVQHICFGYLHFSERLKLQNDDGHDSLFWMMLNRSPDSVKCSRWIEIPLFFWTRTGRTLTTEVKNKILEFWSWTYDRNDFVRTTLGDKYDSFLTQMARLAIILDKIDEVEEKWLLLCAPYVGNVSDAMFFIQCLAKFDDEESLKRIGKLFLKVLENTTPTIKQEDVGLIVQRIYEKGDREIADAISNTYARRGVHFLRPIWDKYHTQKGT